MRLLGDLIVSPSSSRRSSKVSISNGIKLDAKEAIRLEAASADEEVLADGLSAVEPGDGTKPFATRRDWTSS